MKHVAIVFLAYFSALSLFSQESNFAEVKLPLGISMEVPKNWWVISGDLDATIEASGEAMIDLSGIDVGGVQEISFFKANSMPRTTYASISVRCTNAEFTQDEMRGITDEEIAEATPVIRDSTEAVLKQGSQKINEFYPIKMVEIDGNPGMELRYNRTGNKGNVIVLQTRVVTETKEVSFILSYRENEKALWDPIIRYIYKSIRIR
jgi:hypothetical protein